MVRGDEVKEKVLEEIKVTLVEIVGSFLIAIGIVNFAVNANFPLTGFSGIALILYRLFDLPIGFTTVLLNIPVALICFKLLGRRFFLRSIRCILIGSFFIDYVAPLFPVYSGNDLVVSAISTGLFLGLGYSIIYINDSSTGGADFLVMSIKNLKPHISVGKIAFFMDAVIVLIGGILFKNVEGIVYGFIISYLLSAVTDKLIYGMNSGKLALIVTEHGKEIAELCDITVGRGSTVIDAYGGWKLDNKQLVLCATNNKQMHSLEKAIKKFDPASFIIIIESNQVNGEGFNRKVIAEGNN